MNLHQEEELVGTRAQQQMPHRQSFLQEKYNETKYDAHNSVLVTSSQSQMVIIDK